MGCSFGDAEVEKVLREAPPAASLAVAPNGQLMGEPIQDREGILYADVDVAQSITAKMAHDVVCGYQRLDVFDVRLDRRRQLPVDVTGAPPVVAAADGAPPGAAGTEATPSASM
jgi:hypothetical protein